MYFTFFNSSPKIFVVVLFSRFTSCCVSPKLFTSSIFLNDSVVEPASAVVSPNIFFEIILILLLSKLLTNASNGAVIKKSGPIAQWIETA